MNRPIVPNMPQAQHVSRDNQHQPQVVRGQSGTMATYPLPCCFHQAVSQTQNLAYQSQSLANQYLAQFNDTSRELVMVKQRFEATLININEERKQYELMYQEKLALENTAQTLRNNVQGLETKVKSLENTVQHNNALAQALKKQTTRLLGHYNLGHEPCPDPQSISDMLEESAKNALLVQGLTAQFSDPQQLQEMKGQIDIRFEYERREKELRKEIEDNKWEIEQLKNLTDLTDDTHQKKSRRVKAKNISSE